ncbi:MAG: DNA-3-methyladenine glycosylase family protein [Pleomorphochaeta sp.]
MINFDLKNTLFCGQSFCWRVEKNNYVGVLNNKVYRINENSDVEDPYLKQYLDMNFDYPKALATIKTMDEKFVDIIDKCNEIHILNQDLWETIISFILSQNNNIKRIEGLYDTLCRVYGTEIEKGYYSFPRPENMKNATEAELRELRVGFRAPYILDAIQKSDILLELTKETDDEKCDDILQSVKGIGPKVSACVRLFSLHNLNAFPKDVWIKKVMKNEFSDKTEADFFPLAGLAQQYMFHYARLGYFKNI